MNFRGFRIYRGTNTKDATKFLQGDLASTLKDLFSGLTKLNFLDNFQSFEVVVKLQVGVQAPISNKLGSAVPTKFIVVRNSTTSVIVQGDVWNSERVSVINRGPLDTTATIVFMR